MFKCWCCSNTVEVKDDLCYECEAGICETENKIMNNEDIYNV